MLTTALQNNTIAPQGVGYMGGSVLQDKRSGHWFIQISLNGDVERFYLQEFKGHWIPFYAKKQGDKILAIIQHEIDEGIFDPRAYRKDSPLSLKEYSTTWLKSAEICDNTRNKYRGFIKKFMEQRDSEGNLFFGADYDIRKFTFSHSKLVLFKQSLNLSDDSVYNIMGALKTMLNFYRYDNPAFILPKFPPMSKPGKEVTEYLTFEDQQTVLQAIPERHRAIFMFAMEYGLRTQEATALKCDRITDEEVTFDRRHSGYQLLESTKTGERGNRTEKLTTRAKEAIKLAKNWPSFKGWVFCHNQRGSHYDNKILNKIWHKACEDTGYALPLQESIRHSWGCQLLDKGLSLEQVSRDGFKHTSTKTTKRYTHRRRAFMADVLEKRGEVIKIKEAKNE